MTAAHLKVAKMSWLFVCILKKGRTKIREITRVRYNYYQNKPIFLIYPPGHLLLLHQLNLPKLKKLIPDLALDLAPCLSLVPQLDDLAQSFAPHHLNAHQLDDLALGPHLDDLTLAPHLDDLALANITTVS